MCDECTEIFSDLAAPKIDVSYKETWNEHYVDGRMLKEPWSKVEVLTEQVEIGIPKDVCCIPKEIHGVLWKGAEPYQEVDLFLELQHVVNGIATYQVSIL